MCGIVGAMVFDKLETKAAEKIRQEAMIYITTQLLQATVDRGKDATGVSLLWADGNYTGLKMGIPAPDFISRFGGSEKDFEGILKLWREYPKLLKVFLGHCRKSSIGNSYDNKNNHPIQVGDIIMVHNGTLTNHDTIFEKLDCKRDGEVDSEAIARLLHTYTKNGTEPFTMDMLEEVTKRLQGTHSVLAVSGNNPYQVAQFRDTRPAEMVLVRPLKMVLVASKEEYLKTVLYEYNKMSKLFMPGFKFPYLKKADVEFKTLQDDSIMLWDLTTEINDKTEISDLLDWRKSPGVGDRIWRTPVTSYVRNTAYTAANKGGTGTKKAEVNAKSAAGKEGDDEDAAGLVWSSSLNKYKVQDNIDKTKKYGPVEVDVDKGTVTVLGDEDTGNIDISEVGKDKVEDLLTSSAEIKEVGVQRTLNAVSHVGGGKKSDDSSSPESTVVKEVDMRQDPEALKKAEDFVEAGLIKYEDDDEVASDLEISDSAIVRQLPMYALANRIKKFILKQGFVAGYIVRKSEEGGEDENLKLRKKMLGARRRVATLKMTLRIAFKALEERTKGNSEQGILTLLDETIREVVKDSKSLSPENLSSAFTSGDLRNIPLLKTAKEKLEEIAKG